MRGRKSPNLETVERLIHVAGYELTLPLALNWSRPGHEYEVRDRHQRARLYEVVIREGMPQDLMAYVDGALLIFDPRT